MNYYAVWTLKRGSLGTAEVLDEDCMLDVERGLLASMERDPAMTWEQVWYEQGAMAGYYNRRNRKSGTAKVAA